MAEKSLPALIEAFNGYGTDGSIAEKNLCLQLDKLSKVIATDPATREDLPNVFPSIWKYLSELWSIVLSEFEVTVTSDLVVSLARFTRNVVAGVPASQEAAFDNEVKIRGLLHRLSSFSRLEDKNIYPLTRMLVQALSNIVTLNDKLATRLWTLYTTLPEDQNILMRLLASPDSLTLVSTLVLILNCTKTDNEGLRKLLSPIGLRIVVLLLNNTEGWVNQEESEAFTLAYRIFEALLDEDFGTTLYCSLSMEDEPITPHQTTFLKVLDSYIRHQDDRMTSRDHEHEYSFLVKAFLDLSSYCQRAIRRFLGLEYAEKFDSPGHEASPDDLKELDLRLPKVSAALILISQCLTTICLQGAKFRDLSNGVISLTRDDGFIETLIETLRLVDRFLPRIVFGRAVSGPGNASLPTGSSIDETGFVYLKRDLVRLLGTICHEHKEVQDRIRQCGGIPVVMNLCVIDERNPYLQEHALFALRNILHHNPENQMVVDAMKLEQA